MSGRHRRDRSLPPHVQDQVDAASDDVERVLRLMQATRSEGGALYEQEFADGKGESQVMLRVREQMLARQFRSCPHVSSPQPVIVRAWDNPLVVRCPTCNTQAPLLGGEEDYRCDLCGQLEPDHRRFLAAQGGLGPIMVSMGLCWNCSRDSPTPMRLRVKEEEAGD